MRVVVGQFDGVDNVPALPLAAGLLVATAKKDPRLRNAQFEIAIERGPVERVVRSLGGPDVLGVALYPWNRSYALAVAEETRRVYPDCLIVAGGPGVPRQGAGTEHLLATYPQLDVLVLGEGELVFRDLLVAHEAGEGLEAIPNLALRRNGAFHLTASRSPSRDLSQLASAYLEGAFDALLERYPTRFTVALSETNRGCPFSCTFCEWGLEKAVVDLPVERVLGELDWIAERGFTHVYLIDANFGIRRRDAKILHHLAAVKERTGRPIFCFFHLTKNSYKRNLQSIEILQAADIGVRVTLSVQDFDEGVLQAVKRNDIQTNESLRLCDLCGERGIPTLFELILGLPGQTYDSITRTIVQAMQPYPRNRFSLYACLVTENSEMAEPEHQAQHGLVTRRCRWNLSNFTQDPIVEEYQHVVVATHDLPLPEWQRAYRFSYLASAVYNMDLLRLCLHYLTDVVQVDLNLYLRHLSACTTSAKDETVFAALGRTFERYLASILGGNSLTLPVLGAGGTPRDIAQALAIEALRDPPAFYREARDHTAKFVRRQLRTAPHQDELFRYLSLVTPRFRDAKPVEASFDYDWPAFTNGMAIHEPLEKRRTVVRYTPPSYVEAEDFEQFITVHLGTVQSDCSTGGVESQPALLADPAFGQVVGS